MDRTENENGRNAAYESQTTEQYAALGQFMTEFEQICQTLRLWFVFLLGGKGLKDQTVANIIVGNQAFSAGPLIEMMEGLVGHLVGDAVKRKIITKEEAKVGKDIFGKTASRFRKLTKIRNRIVHGTWFIGWASPEQTDFSEMHGYKPSPNKKGMAIKELPKSVDEMHAYIAEAKNINALFWRFNGCMQLANRTPGEGDFSKNFTKADDGSWLPERPT